MAKKRRREKQRQSRAKRPKVLSSQQRAQLDVLVEQAVQLGQHGRLQEAMVYFQRALVIEPRQPAVLHSLGLMKDQLGSSEEAVKLLRQAIIYEPREPVCHNNLGNALRNLGRLAEAVEAYKAALALDPNYVNALYNLATLLFDKEYGQGVEYLERAARLASDDTQIWELLGRTRAKLQQPDLAEQAFRSALRTDPSNADAYSGLGGVCLDRGLLEQARDHWKKALDLQPGHPHCVESLARSKKYTLADLAEIETTESLLASAPDDEAACVLSFALGKMYDDCGLYDKAFPHYAEGNRLRWSRMSFDAESVVGTVSRLESVFTKEFFDSRRDFGIDSDVPIFVVGLPRSGTTLVEQIIASHPSACGAGEVPFLLDLISGLSKEVGCPFPECVAEIDRAHTKKLAETYLKQLQGVCPDASRVSDKALSGGLNLGLVALMFPNARVVYCKRNPLDIGLSMFFQRFATGSMEFTFDMRAIGIFCRQYRELMRYWQCTLPLPIHEVVYEDMVEDQEMQTRALVEHCGLDWDERSLAFHQSRRTVNTASHWQVRRPIYKTSVNRAEAYRKHLGVLETLLTDEL